ncbi:MAG: dihydrodipicolinate synthase family protein [Chloroflexi bacterium]|nr:dihydrodipicolinate synthase family protein [Chloroflexota bacterium]MBI5830610.1 dihydrodipicolinate synthase family protein [Chloroflexota bacterium]
MKLGLSGIIVPIVTPFDEQERFSPAALKEIVDYLIGQGVQAVFAVGSVGEFYALDEDEILQVIRTTVQAVAGRVPVIAGTGAIDTRRSLALSRKAEEAGADALSVLTPFYIQPNEEELFQHYSAILSAVRIPVLGYTNPGRAGGVTLTPGLVRRLCGAHENFAGIKDSSGNISLLKDYKTACPEDFAIFTGLDTIIYDAVLNEAAGAVCGLANIAAGITVDVYRQTCAGNLAEARRQQAKISILRDAYRLGTFPAVVKEAVNLLGLPAGPTRGPVGPLRPEARAQLRQILINVLGPEIFIARQ